MNKLKLYTKRLLMGLFSGLLIISSLGLSASAESTYTTYTFNSKGKAVNSPDAYQFIAEYDGKFFGTDSLKDPCDLFVDKNNNIYIVDKGNNRIVILNSDFSLKKIIAEFEMTLSGDKITDKFTAPSSVFVSDNGHLYVADTDNQRIVEFDENYVFVRQIGCPNSKVLGNEYIFAPIAVTVDSSYRLYVMIKNENQGIVQLESDGSFIGYYGAQKVENTFFDLFRQLFMTKEQKSRVAKIIPRTYNSMAIDSKDFVWLTSNSLTVYQQKAYMQSKSSTNAPIKRLNPSGNDVLTRQGKYAPGGDLSETSSLVDVAVKSDGTYSLLDNTKNRIFTYDEKGNLLYAFGGNSTQDGCLTLAAAIAYLNDDIIVLDSADNLIVRYGMTEYARSIQNALAANEDKDFDASIKYWSSVLEQNQNLELAYKSMGDNYLRIGEYETAMDYYKNAEEKDGYSKAFQYVRTQYVKKHLLLILGIAVAVALLIYLYKKWVNKQNRLILPTGQRYSLKNQLVYAHRVIYHPCDGFWEIKMQNHGGLLSATIILAITVLTFCYREVATGYLFRTDSVEEIDLPITSLKVIVPLALWCVSSWGLTTLFEGKGNMGDIYVMTCYSTFPLIFTNLICTVMSNGMLLTEGDFVTFFTYLGFVWMAFLIIFGSMTIHDYQFGKNTLMIILSIVGMAVMLFLALLFVTVGQKMVDFFVGIYEEVVYRL